MDYEARSVQRLLKDTEFMKTYLTDFKVFPKTLESHDSLACILDDFMTMSGVSAPIKGVLANMKKRVADTIGYV